MFKAKYIFGILFCNFNLPYVTKGIHKYSLPDHTQSHTHCGPPRIKIAQNLRFQIWVQVFVGVQNPVLLVVICWIAHSTWILEIFKLIP